MQRALACSPAQIRPDPALLMGAGRDNPSAVISSQSRGSACSVRSAGSVVSCSRLFAVVLVPSRCRSKDVGDRALPVCEIRSIIGRPRPLFMPLVLLSTGKRCRFRHAVRPPRIRQIPEMQTAFSVKSVSMRAGAGVVFRSGPRLTEVLTPWTARCFPSTNNEHREFQETPH